MSSIRGKRPTYLVLAAALVIFIASLANTGLRLIRIDRDIAEGFGENLVWTVVQGEIELLRLLDALDRLGSETAEPQEVIRRYDLFWSRLRIMQEGEVGARLAAIKRIGDTVSSAAALLTELEPEISALVPGDSSRAEQVRERLRQLQPRLHDASVWTAQAELDRSAAHAQSRREVLFEALLYLIGLFVAALLLVGLLIRELRQTRQLTQLARLAEAEAKRSEQRFRDVVDAASDWIWETGPDHCFTFISEQLAALSGEKPEDVLGKARWQLRLPDDLDDSNWSKYRAAVEAHEPIRNFVFPYRDRKGRRHFSRVHGKPFFDTDGRFLGYRGTGRDITAELEAAQEIAESRKLLRAVINAVPAVINVKDSQLRYVLMNEFEAQVYGVAAEEVIGKSSVEIAGGVFGEESRELDRRVLATGRPLPFAEREFTDRHGVRRFWWSAKKPLLDEAGAVRYIVTAALDITQLKATERARSNLSRYFSPNMVDVLAGADEALRTVRSHDAGILFADIIGFSQFTTTERPEQAFAVIREFHARMARIVFRFEGTLDKYIGDGLMASFGTPRPGRLDATHTIQCARAMAQEIADWNAERVARGQHQVRIAIGAHYGPVLLGDIGDERRLEFAVLGETVNIASRLEGMTRQLRVPVVVSDALIQMARRESEDGALAIGGFANAGVHSIRGMATPLVVWVMEEPAPTEAGLALPR
ncbi:MAG TPA: PAS domain S-box protein [Alphaproteobacteria bacterium]|nr:PAS domain S-box protein [Alphaproteobacteria bacterium]